MCGRYASFLPAEALARLFETKGPVPNLEPTWNMAPTKDALGGAAGPRWRAAPRCRQVGPGAILHQGSCQREEADQCPVGKRGEIAAVQGGFRHRRCLVPAAAYYEWRHDPSGKTPFAIARKDGEPVVFGGMWEEWRSSDGERLRTFATMTIDANPPLSLIQERMPVIIEREDWKIWLGEEEGDVTALLRPLPSDRLRIWPVDRKVNNVKNDGPGLLEPHSVQVEEPVLL
jgi:putative SOS response-associated peptidase YedK